MDKLFQVTPLELSQGLSDSKPGSFFQLITFSADQYHRSVTVPIIWVLTSDLLGSHISYDKGLRLPHASLGLEVSF